MGEGPLVVLADEPSDALLELLDELSDALLELSDADQDPVSVAVAATVTDM